MTENRENRPVMVGIELIVADLDRAIELWTEVMGWSLADRGAASTIAGRYAVVTDDGFAITLLHPAEAGPGHLLADRQPRLSQILLAVDSSDLDRYRSTAAEHGLSVVPNGRGFFIAPESVAGALGLEAALVVAPEAIDPEP